MTNSELHLLLQHLEDHHPGELNHGERVSVYSVATANALGMSEDDLVAMRYAGALHDIGKLDIRADLLAKTSRLEGTEVLEMRNHVAYVVDHVRDELLTAWIAAHHERWDGTGYLHGLAGDAIPIGARIISVAETFDVLLNDRRWREPLTEDAALDEVRRCAGTQFDPRVVEAFLSVQPLIQPIQVAARA